MCKIAIIDDDKTDLFLLNSLLKKISSKFELYTFSSLHEAIISSKKYDVIFTDIFMKGSFGVEVIRTLKEHFPKSYVIAVTGAVDGFLTGKTQMNLMENGAEDVIDKADVKLELIEFVLNEYRSSK